MTCLHYGLDMPQDSMHITVRDAVLKGGVTLANLCSYTCIIRWATPMAETLEQPDRRTA